MHNLLINIKNSIKKPFVYIPAILIIAFLITITVRNNSSKADTNLVTVAPQEFTQEVSVTGKVVSAQEVGLGFETSGRVARVNVAVGDKVSVGQTLAYVSNGDYSASISQRQAAVESEQAKLAELQRGARPEDISLAQADVDSAKISVDQAKRNLVDQVKDSYTKADDALRSKIDQLYSNPRSVRPEIIPFETSNTPYGFEDTLNEERLKVGEMMTRWNVSLASLNSDNYTRSYFDEARTNIGQMRTFLNDLSIVVSTLQTNPSMSQGTVDKYKNDISQARTNVSAAASSLTSADQGYTSAQASQKRSEEQLAIKQSGTAKEQIDAQVAQVKSAQAQLQSARASYGKTVISSPINGIVTKVDTKAGEISSPNTSVISLISASNYQIESFISETDIAKLKVGQTSNVTLDAYGKNVPFPATVTAIDPAETLKDGASTYKATFQFVSKDDRIKSGMTANITIETDKRPAVIVIPQQALSLKNGEKVVRVKSGNKEIEKIVQTGSINNNGDIEIISGLEVGDQIIISAK